jgi:hypothetical protein
LISNPALLEGFRAQTRSSILRKGMTSAAMVQNYLNLYSRLLPGQGPRTDFFADADRSH